VGDAPEAVGLFESASALHRLTPTIDLWRGCYLAAAHLEADGEAELLPGLLERIGESGDESLLILAHLLAAAIAAADGRPFGEHLRLAVDTARDIGLAANVLVEGAAAVALRAHQPAASALLMGHPNPGHVFASSVGLRRRVRSAVGDAEFDPLLAEGAQLSDDDLIALILGLDVR